MRINTGRASYYARCLARAREAFTLARGAGEVERRAADIARLPSKAWNGVQLFEVECEGPFGKGPHRQFIPEYVLWSLMDVGHFICPYHR